jgi:hypothetical protein
MMPAPGTTVTMYDNTCVVNRFLEFTRSAGIEFIEDYVGDIAVPHMEAAASSSNSQLPAILMILPNDHHLLQK